MSDYKEIAGETISRGEIYWLRNGAEGVGSEQVGLRPCVVVSNEKANTYSTMVTIVPLTTAEKKPLPTHAEINSAIESSIALCEQVKTISKNRLAQYIGECTEDEMRDIERGLRIQLDLVETSSVTSVTAVKQTIPPVMEETVKPQEKCEELEIKLIQERTRADIYEKLYKELMEKKAI
ncbi:MAG: type II toxin-antitoxin system PemK/MazF family toxin [Clostridia bacterium]|nr:type II toxin-antitoxin system PemK/MazF family toxin [Clostridia bacterium]